MEIPLFKHQYDQLLHTLEEFQIEMQGAILSLLSPAHEQDTLPSFVKRIRRSLSLVPTNSNNNNTNKSGGNHAETTQGKNTYRFQQWQKALSILKKKLHHLRSQMEQLGYPTE